MPKITWLGDAECIWNDVTFPAGVPVEITDAYMIGKARHNPFFRLDETVSGPMPEMWTNTPPDDLPLKRKRGRPPKVRTDGVQ